MAHTLERQHDENKLFGGGFAKGLRDLHPKRKVDPATHDPIDPTNFVGRRRLDEGRKVADRSTANNDPRPRKETSAVEDFLKEMTVGVFDDDSEEDEAHDHGVDEDTEDGSRTDDSERPDEDESPAEEERVDVGLDTSDVGDDDDVKMLM